MAANDEATRAAAKARSRMFMLDAAVHADAFAGQVPWGEAPATAAVFLDLSLIHI